MTKKSFNEKLQDSGKFPEIIPVDDPRQIRQFGGNRMLIAPPLAYDAVMRRIPAGQVTTADRIRIWLARQHDADFTCPLTAGIFINIVAQASAERGFDETPYWRTLKKDGELNEKYPGGLAGQRAHLEAEGLTVTEKGRRLFVADYQAWLCDLD